MSFLLSGLSLLLWTTRAWEMISRPFQHWGGAKEAPPPPDAPHILRDWAFESQAEPQSIFSHLSRVPRDPDPYLYGRWEPGLLSLPRLLPSASVRSIPAAAPSEKQVGCSSAPLSLPLQAGPKGGGAPQPGLPLPTGPGLRGQRAEAGWLGGSGVGRPSPGSRKWEGWGMRAFRDP